MAGHPLRQGDLPERGGPIGPPAASDYQEPAHLIESPRVEDSADGAVAPFHIFIWLLVQWSALLIAAVRIPLAAHYWPDPELHALQILLAVQFSWTAILFPILCRSWRMGVATLASGWVMLLLAAALSAWPPTEVFPCAGYIGVWVTALTFWRGALKRNWLQMMASALIVAFTIGGPIIWYFGSDLTQRTPAPSTWQFGPLLGVLANLAKPPTSGWTLLFLMAGSGFTIRLLRHWRTRPHFAPPGNPDRHFSTGR